MPINLLKSASRQKFKAAHYLPLFYTVATCQLPQWHFNRFLVAFWHQANLSRKADFSCYMYTGSMQSARA
jgi:hypothetical protein